MLLASAAVSSASRGAGCVRPHNTPSRVGGGWGGRRAAGGGGGGGVGWARGRAGAGGAPPADTVFNGPYKTDDELELAAAWGTGLVVVDGPAELAPLARCAERAGVRVPIALRVCPGVRARGMNVSSATGARRAQFGCDLRSGEIPRAIRAALAEPAPGLRGAMAHIGSGAPRLCTPTQATAPPWAPVACRGVGRWRPPT